MGATARGLSGEAQFHFGNLPEARFQIGPKIWPANSPSAAKTLKTRVKCGRREIDRVGHKRALGTAWVAFQRSAPFANGEEGARMRMGRVVPTCL